MTSFGPGLNELLKCVTDHATWAAERGVAPVCAEPPAGASGGVPAPIVDDIAARV